MAMQSPFFNKRETDPFNTRYGQPNSGLSGSTNSVQGSAATPSAGSAGQQASAATGKDGESKLTVGPNIKLRGVEITDCDTLVVEGSVEATMDSRVIQISERGAFKGSAEIDIAEIRGEFDGSLTVRQKLMIYSTGKVTGKIRYGKVVIEEGGQLSGEISFGTQAAGRQAVPIKTVSSTPMAA
ncbi:MAG: polymer-forming cytoskeletal protein [Ramlibacter sp.]|nr:polymer-forming cytoskeletal protein [Ramlibacter sp.]MCW5650469.1 polymer-forming cytoskeletal protein [Ramlibacter sp.]